MMSVAKLRYGERACYFARCPTPSLSSTLREWILNHRLE